MAYGDYDGPNKPDKGIEGGSCNRKRCQCSPARWFNHGSFSWYCDDCRRDIWASNRDTFHIDMPGVTHPMFETREMMDARTQAHAPVVTDNDLDLIEGLIDGFDHLGTGSDSRGAERDRIEANAAWKRVRTSITAAKAESPTSAGNLLPMVWTQFTHREDDQKAETVAGVYMIRPAAVRFRLWVPDAHYNDATMHDTTEAAKDAAWEHYQRRMSSAYGHATTPVNQSPTDDLGSNREYSDAV